MRKLFTLKDLLLILNVSEATLRRWVAESRKGTGDFPKPISGFQRKLLWNPADIERWTGGNQQSAPVCNTETPTKRSQRHAAAMKKLAAKGVTLPSQQCK